MGCEKSLASIFSSETFGRSARSLSWPEGGVAPTHASSAMIVGEVETSDDVTDNTLAVYHYNEEGIQVTSRKRESGESLEDFKARVALVLGETANSTEVEFVYS